MTWPWGELAEQIPSGRLPVERIVTSGINLRDVVSAGIEGLAHPEGDQVKILVSPTDGACR